MKLTEAEKLHILIIAATITITIVVPLLTYALFMRPITVFIDVNPAGPGWRL